MATWAPTARARAPTVLNWLQLLSVAHTVNVRRLPRLGGLASGVTAAARPVVAAPNARVRPRARSIPSNRIAAARGDGPSTIRWASGIAAAVTVPARSRKEGDLPKVPTADRGTS